MRTALVVLIALIQIGMVLDVGMTVYESGEVSFESISVIDDRESLDTLENERTLTISVLDEQGRIIRSRDVDVGFEVSIFIRDTPSRAQSVPLSVRLSTDESARFVRVRSEGFADALIDLHDAYCEGMCDGCEYFGFTCDDPIRDREEEHVEEPEDEERSFQMWPIIGILVLIVTIIILSIPRKRR